jgi:hypothetical protein
MDENEYHTMRMTLTPIPCVFSKSILAMKLECRESSRKNIAGRELIQCLSAINVQQCSQWLRLLRQKSQFALQTPEQSDVLPHAKEMKVQVGGIMALQKIYRADVMPEIKADIAELLARCVKDNPEFEGVPFDVVIREVKLFRLR